MTARTVVEILGKDNTKQAFDSVKSSLGAIESAASSAKNTLLGLAAGLVSIQSVRAIADAALDVQKFNNSLQVGLGSVEAANDAMSFLRKTANELGLDLRSSTEQFAKLSAAAKGTALEGQATRDIFLGISKAAVSLGLSSDEAAGALLAIQQMVSKGKVSLEELSGQLGERLPGALQIAARSMGMTTQELNAFVSSGKLTADQLLPALAAELEKTFGTQSQTAAQGLQAQINRFNTALFDLKVAIGETGLIDFLSDGIQLATRLANALSGLFGKGEQLSAIEKQRNAIAGLREELASLNDKKNIPLVGSLLFDKRQADLLEQRIEDAVADLAKMEAAAAKVTVEENKLAPATAAVTTQIAAMGGAVKKTVSDSQKFLEALAKEAAQSGKSSFELKRLEAAHLGVLKAASPLIDALEREADALRRADEAASQYRSQLARAASITESVMTDSEKYAQTQAELNVLYQQGFISLETYNRALSQASGGFQEIKDTGTSAFNEIDQAAIQAARNIQTALADALLEGIKGFDNFAKSALNVVKRLAAEIASVKILQGLGLGGSLGLGASSAAASTGGGLGSALNIASLGSNIGSLFSTGLGATGLAGGAISAAGSFIGSGSTAAFGAGLAGDLIGGVAAGVEAGMSGAAAASAASMGASLASIAGPAIALFAVDQIGRLLAGDKRTGTIADSIPVIGGFAGALFGRGPLKQKETNLIGDFTVDGFEGVTSTKFKAKGGALRSSKVDRVITDTDTGELLNRFGDLVEGGISKELLPFADQAKQYSTQLGKFLDESIAPISKGLIDLADNLGLGKNALDDFSFSVNIASEKGQALKDEQIAEIIGDASEAMARKLVPEIDSLKRNGESAYQAVQRVNTEFNALNSVLQVIGINAESSRSALLDMSIEQRTALIDLAGGVEQLGQKSGFFFSNILTDADRLNILGGQLSESLKKFGIEGGVSVEQLREAVLSNMLTPEELNAAFDLAPLILEVDTLRNSAVEAAPEVEKLAEKIEVSFNETSLVVDGITQSIQKLKSFVEGLKGSINDILGVDSLTSARRNITDVLGQDRIKMNDLLGLSSSVQALGGARDTSQFSTRFDLIMSRAQDAQLVQQITGIAEERIRKLSQGLVTFLRGDDLPRFSSGSSFVPSTGPAIVHQGERIINPQQNQDLVDLLRQLVQKVSEGTTANVDLYRRLGNVLTETDSDGLALRTKAAT